MVCVNEGMEKLEYTGNEWSLTGNKFECNYLRAKAFGHTNTLKRCYYRNRLIGAPVAHIKTHVSHVCVCRNSHGGGADVSSVD